MTASRWSGTPQTAKSSLLRSIFVAGIEGFRNNTMDAKTIPLIQVPVSLADPTGIGFGAVLIPLCQPPLFPCRRTIPIHDPTSHITPLAVP